MGNGSTDPAARPEVMADALGRAAVQTAQRALFTAQLAADAMARAGGGGRQADAAALRRLRNGRLDAYGAVPEETRKRLSACRASLTSDEIIDLLALSVRG